MPDFNISTFRIKISAPHLPRLPRPSRLPRLPPSPAYSRVTFVVICVVSTLSRPSKSCSVRISVPLSSKCVANECRSTCGVGREPAHFSPATTAGCLDKKRGAADRAAHAAASNACACASNPGWLPLTWQAAGWPPGSGALETRPLAMRPARRPVTAANVTRQ